MELVQSLSGGDFKEAILFCSIFPSSLVRTLVPGFAAVPRTTYSISPQDRTVEYPWKSKNCRNLRFKILPPLQMQLRKSSPMLLQSLQHHTYYVILQSCNYLSVCCPRHDQGRVMVYQNSVPSIGNRNWQGTHRSFMEEKEREEREEEREKNLL